MTPFGGAYHTSCAQFFADAIGLDMKLDQPLLRSLPKVLLHEHLDGVLRPQTVIELAREIGYTDLPKADAASSRSGFIKARTKGAWPSISKASNTPSQ